jgi:hypothetical protein
MSRKKTSVVHVDADQAVQISELPDLRRLAGLAPRVRVLLDEAIAERKKSAGIAPFTSNQVITLLSRLTKPEIKEVLTGALELLSESEPREEEIAALGFIRALLKGEKPRDRDLAILANTLGVSDQQLTELLNEDIQNGST